MRKGRFMPSNIFNSRSNYLNLVSIIFMLHFLCIAIAFKSDPINAQTVVTIIGLGPPSGNGIGPNGVGVNPTTNRIYVANGGSGNVSVIDGETNQLNASMISWT